MKNFTILVSGASGIVGYGILKSLQQYHYKLIGTTIYSDSITTKFADIVEIAPVSTSEEYIPWLINIIKKYQINMLIPGIECDMQIWNNNRHILNQTGAFILLNNSKLIEICLDKWLFYKTMKKYNSPYIIESSLDKDADQFSLPFILKKRCGYGSKGLVKIESKNEFEKYKKNIGNDLMIQEYVGNQEDEYTVAAFFDESSDLKAHISLKRKLSSQGYTVAAEVVHIDNMEAILKELSFIFQPIGPTNFQFRKDNGNWKLLEINPRISSSTSIRTAFGYNEIKMSIDYFLNKKEIIQPQVTNGKAIRYIEDFIIYDSDNI